MQKERFSFKKIKTEYAGKTAVTFLGLLLIIVTLSLVFFIASKGISLFMGNKMSPWEFLFSSVWEPSGDEPKVGALIFIAGSVTISLLALIISVPLSMGAALFMAEVSPKFGKKILQPAIEIFVGIPSVVYGWVGMSVLVPFVKAMSGGTGKSVLAGSLVLAVMIFPTITSVAADAIKSQPREYKEASFGLGGTQWQTIYRILVPAAGPGILTGIVLGLARAFGEALAVQMVIGNSLKFPKGITDSTINMTSQLAMEMGNTSMGSLENNALWSLALLLLIISFLFIFVIKLIGKKGGAQR